MFDCALVRWYIDIEGLTACSYRFDKLMTLCCSVVIATSAPTTNWRALSAITQGVAINHVLCVILTRVLVHGTLSRSIRKADIVRCGAYIMDRT